MTPLFTSRRDAEELDSALAGTASTAVTERHAELLATVATMRTAAEVTPGAEFVEDLRARLMLAAETQLVAAPPVARRLSTTRTRASHRAGSIAAALVIVGGTAGMAAAASGSLPGEPLYPLKRGGEQVGEAVRVTDASKGRALLGQARNRLSEVQALMSGGAGDQALVEDTLGAFQTAADDGSQKLFVSFQRNGDAADVDAVRSFTASQMHTLDGLVSSATPQQSAALLDAADTLADIDQQARSLCGACGGGDSTLLTPAALSQGAAAASDNLLARPMEQAGIDVAAAKALAAKVARVQQSSSSTPTKVDLPRVPAPSSPAGGAAEATAPVTSAVGGDKVVPGLKAGTKAVDGLVEGVSSTLDTATKGAAAPLTTTVQDTTKTVTGTVDSTLDGVGGLLP